MHRKAPVTTSAPHSGQRQSFQTTTKARHESTTREAVTAMP